MSRQIASLIGMLIGVALVVAAWRWASRIPSSVPVADLPMTAERVQQTQILGNQIVQALQNYRAQYSTYPPELAGLVPEFLQRLPTPTAGLESWEYETLREGGDFSLCFGSNMAGPVFGQRWPAYFVGSSGEWSSNN